MGRLLLKSVKLSQQYNIFKPNESKQLINKLKELKTI